MLKALNKLKPGKSKREKSERHAPSQVADDSQSPLKASKHKEKSRTGKNKKKKLGAHSFAAEGSQSSDDQDTGMVPQAVPEDQTSNQADKGESKKKKPEFSKECIDSVNKAVQEFFECAWAACTERFFIATAPITVSFELRNTWLRIVESEWLDLDMKGKTYTGLNRIFQKDDAPLPLAYDTWSRGTVEILPRFRRESVMDPFLRDLDSFSQLPIPGRLASISSLKLDLSSSDDTEIEEIEGFPEDEHQRKSLHVRLSGIPEDIRKSEKYEAPPSAGETWDPELDKPLLEMLPDMSEPNESRTVTTASQHSIVNLSSGDGSGNGTPFQTLLPARQFTVDELTSTTDVDDSSPDSREEDMVAKRYRIAAKKFKPSQCGGKNRSGIFRLHAETTSEALDKIGKLDENGMTSTVQAFQLVERNAREKEDIVHVTRKGESLEIEVYTLTPKDEEDRMVVQPLFEEHTPRLEGSESTQRQNEVNWLRRSVSATYFKGRKTASLIEAASDIHHKLVTRRLVHLHARFKRQALRSLAISRNKHNEAKKKQKSGSGTNGESPGSSVQSSAASITSYLTTNTTRRNTIINAKTDRKASSVKRKSNSISSFQEIQQGARTWGDKRLTAKSVASEPRMQFSTAFNTMGNVRTSLDKGVSLLGGKFRVYKNPPPPPHLHTRMERKFQRLPDDSDQARVCQETLFQPRCGCRSPASTASSCSCK